MRFQMRKSNLERYIRIENDPAIGWSVVGSGTRHIYVLSFNGLFTFVHQNDGFEPGKFLPYANTPVLQVISQGQKVKQNHQVQFPTVRKLLL